MAKEKSKKDKVEEVKQEEVKEEIKVNLVGEKFIDPAQFDKKEK